MALPLWESRLGSRHLVLANVLTFHEMNLSQSLFGSLAPRTGLHNYVSIVVPELRHAETWQALGLLAIVLLMEVVTP